MENKNKSILVLVPTTFLLSLLITFNFEGHIKIFSTFGISSSNLATIAFQNSLHYSYNNIQNILYHNIKIPNRDIALNEYNSANYYHNYYYTKSSISFNTVVNNESNITNCSNKNNNSNINSTAHIISNFHYVLPPKIVMVYSGKEFDVGNLFNSKYREGTTLTQLQLPIEKITTHLPNKATTIIKGSCLGFLIKDNPLALPPSSMGVTAYNNQGKAVNVLSTSEHSKSTFFNINLNEGKYILLVVATWLPSNENISGYLEYNYMVNVVNSK